MARAKLETLILAAAASAALAGAGPAKARVPREDFPLGRSANSGAVCQAVRDWDDPAAGDPRIRIWQVKCRGWTQTLGRLYFFEGGAARKGETLWRSELASRADCAAPKRASVSGVSEAAISACKTKGVGAAYVALSGVRGGLHGAAEGFAPVGDVLETGLKVITGVQPAPSATAEQRGGAEMAAVQGGGLASLNAALGQADQSVESRRETAYRESQTWQFSDAEIRFSQILADPSAPLATRAEAALNLALNVSNTGRFRDADQYFALADKLAAQTQSRSLQALALNYKAAHARNQREFEDAIELAQQAIAARPAASAEVTMVSADPAGDLVIGPGAATALNTQGARFSIRRLTAAQLERVRDAQAFQIEGTSLEALGRTAAARAALENADQILVGQGLGAATPWLTARVEADLARVELAEGHGPQALQRLTGAVAEYSSHYPGSLAEGGFLMELARMRAETGDVQGSLSTYEDAFAIFREQRGALGASADMAGDYFDLLLRRIGSNPAADQADVTRFFDAAQAVVSEASAQAVAQFAARISQGDTASAGLSRARDDTLRMIEAKETEIRQLQAANAYQGAVKLRVDAELDDLRKQATVLEQRLLETNPRYGAILNASVSLSDLQHSLRPGEAYVKVLLLANRGYGLLITSTTAKPYAIDLTREHARELVDQLRRPFDEVGRTGRLSSYNVGLAHELFADLFGPVQSDVLTARHLIYEPDATLIGVPASALVVDGASKALMKQHLEEARRTHQPLSYAGVKWLGAQLDNSVAISTASFWQVRKLAQEHAQSKAANAFIGFGDPMLNGDPREFKDVNAEAEGLRGAGAVDVCADVRQALLKLPPLPHTAEEVRTVAQSLHAPLQDVRLGPSFTDTAIMQMGDKPGGLDQYRILYFATHGLLPLPNGCLEPSLVTSLGDGPSDALLDMDKIFNLKLDADLVVLSACDTGRSGPVNDAGAAVNGGGDALGGLVRAFIYAGARNLVVSNWKVDTAATERLMTSMFEDGGDTQGEALRKAELSMMDSPDQYSHPFYWAAFTVVGDGERPMPRP